MSRFKPRLTYSNVIATLALFLALGGVSYAAMKLPKNSVGAKQIKVGAVGSEEVKDTSLKAVDFAAGVLGSGPKGEKGDQGEKGDKGDKGDPADLGFLDDSHDLPGLAMGNLLISSGGGSFPTGDFKAYRIDCTTAKLCTVTIGGFRTPNIEYHAWYELALLGDPSATKNFSLNEYTTKGGNVVARYHVTNGRPSVMRTLNNRFELTFTTEFVQRVSV